MKVQVNGIDLFELSEMQKKVICNDIAAPLLEEDMKRRLEYVLMHKYERCFERLKKEWDQKLPGRVDSVPTDKDAYAQLVFSQPDYKDRQARDKDNG